MEFMWDLLWDSWETSLSSKKRLEKKYGLSKKKQTVVFENSLLNSIFVSIELRS